MIIIPTNIKQLNVRFVTAWILSANISHQTEPVCTVTQTKHYKLAKWSIKTYDGSLINYLSLWSQ